MSPNTIPIAPMASLYSGPLGVAVRACSRRFGFGASSRGDVHVMNSNWTDCGFAFLCPAGSSARARALALPFGAAIARDRGEKPVYRPAQSS